MTDAITEELDRTGFAQRTHEQLSDEEYHARPEWSASQLKLLPDEPELFHGRFIDKLRDWQQKRTESMRIGAMLHSHILLDQELVPILEEVLTTNGQRRGKKWDEWRDANAGKLVCTTEELWNLTCAAESVREHPKYSALFAGDDLREHSIFWKDANTNLPMRCRIDSYTHLGDGVIVDLKTTQSAGINDFMWSALKYKYHVQAAMYMEGAARVFGRAPEKYIIVAVEVLPPYLCFFYELDKDAIAAGRALLDSARFDLYDRSLSNDWQNSSRGILLNLNLPKKS